MTLEWKGSKTSRARRRIPDLKARVYRDGHPIHQLQYLQVKLILRGDRFTSTRNLRDFGRFVAKVADRTGVGVNDGFEQAAPRMREVLFLDTADFLLYRHAFILRRRFPFEDGFLVGDPEIVFKYRHPHLQTAAEMDVRPRIAGDYRVKFKAQALPLRDRLGGVRLLFSHNVQFPASAVRQVNRRSMATVLEVLPVLQRLKPRKSGRIELVNKAAIEEILMPMGRLDFGKGIKAKANVSLWRTRGDLQQLVGEFSFQIRFKGTHDLPDKPIRRCERFFLALQQAGSDWLALGTTKTGSVYAITRQAPRSHE